jgi:hypothetical protein
MLVAFSEVRYYDFFLKSDKDKISLFVFGACRRDACVRAVRLLASTTAS